MQITLLGSAVDGPWPDPWCGCDGCARELAAGRRRDRASVLIGDRLLLDVPFWGRPGLAGAAAVSSTLTEHSAAPPNPGSRRSPGIRQDRGVSLAAGDVREVAGLRVRAIPADEPGTVALLVPAADLLYAPHGAHPPTGEALPGTLILGAPVPHESPAGGGTVIALARHGSPAVFPHTAFPDDDTPLAGRRLVLITGGTRSGKSRHAERLLAGSADVTYLATGPVPGPDDGEWSARVEAHRRRRPAGWTTAEHTDAAAVLTAATGPVLWDCVGTWLTAQLDDVGAWEQRPGWREALEARVETLLTAWRAATGTVVAVTNEVGSAVVPATTSGRLFTDLLGRVNTRLADEADEVLLVVAGRAIRL